MDISADNRFSLYGQGRLSSPTSSMSRAEPMVMGSPSSPHPGSHNSSQYLPGFLLGDHTPGPSNYHGCRVNLFSETIYQ
ncbi:hypothetical protein EB796_015304 [Bugula neritina]|uniref:Uncharacterized protein n=1 Tax=Bugula neritina TaxID=10212 RepID=A0A7J7JJ83_BUGNE|nr:hypothetical protein EB796_015304 [Bugula neritina]